MAVGLSFHPSVQQPSFEPRPQLKLEQFDDLVVALKDALGPSSGLDSSDVDVNALTRHMRTYDAREKGWVPYAMADPDLAYTRNLVDEGNGKSNLLVLVWTPGKGSPIHDHGNAHCIMKILHGSLTESRYEFPDSDKEKPMRLTSQRVHEANAVAYMADELGLHKMENTGDDYAISLHLYTPPNVAKSGCHTFNPITGERSYVPKCGYYSKFTQKI
ncbi:RmlC-like cupin domain-containing protein [Coniella lustricola]|uniref:Cysteine dioxygenase n=1 Tax=Coniella lustricola TaxID=2025994 RepID=A0A2T2ZVV2_9PEZI|nr:RmlC-like cupin domain-containing protein [Coniella lustricola]